MTDQPDPAPIELAPHGARWSADHAAQVTAITARHLPEGSLVWDGCAGTSERFHNEMGPAAGWRTFGSEIEAEWAGWNPYTGPLDVDGWPTLAGLFSGPAKLGTITADSTTIPQRFRGVFAGFVSSLVFDNRFGDTYLGTNDYATTGRCPACRGRGTPIVDVPVAVGPLHLDQPDPYPIAATCEHCAGTGRVERAPRLKRFTTPNGYVVRPDRANYTAMLGKPLKPNNAGRHRGASWRRVSTDILRAAFAAVRPGGIVAFEIKDAFETVGTGKAKRTQRITSLDWSLGLLTNGGLPCRVIEVHALDAVGYLNGANRDVRAELTQVVVAEVR